MAKMLDEMAEASLRCIAFGYRPLQAAEVAEVAKVGGKEQWVLPDNDLILLAILGIKVRGWGCCYIEGKVSSCCYIQSEADGGGVSVCVWVGPVPPRGPRIRGKMPASRGEGEARDTLFVWLLKLCGKVLAALKVNG